MGKHRSEQCCFTHNTIDIDNLSIAISESFFCCSVHVSSYKCFNQKSIKQDQGSQLLTVPQSAVQNSVHTSSLKQHL